MSLFVVPAKAGTLLAEVKFPDFHRSDGAFLRHSLENTRRYFGLMFF